LDPVSVQLPDASSLDAATPMSVARNLIAVPALSMLMEEPLGNLSHEKPPATLSARRPFASFFSVIRIPIALMAFFIASVSSQGVYPYKYDTPSAKAAITNARLVWLLDEGRIIWIGGCVLLTGIKKCDIKISYF
jgi:hypothetical protein